MRIEYFEYLRWAADMELSWGVAPKPEDLPRAYETLTEEEAKNIFDSLQKEGYIQPSPSGFYWLTDKGRGWFYEFYQRGAR